MKNQPPSIRKRYYSIREAASLLGVTPLTMRNWDNAGKLRARRNPINRYRVYKAEDLELFLRKLEGGGTTLDIL